MSAEAPVCCPYCQCRDVSQAKRKGLIEIGALEFDQTEDQIPVDIWICSECQRRFFVTDTPADKETPEETGK